MLSTSANKLAYIPKYRWAIGNREVVGPCVAGVESYFDRNDLPCPTIRYKKPSPEIDALREKEKGDWRSLSIDDKRALYRASFRQTFAEFNAPTALGRRLIGKVMCLLCVPITIFVIMKKTVFPPLPESMSDQNKKQLVRWYIETRTDRMDGGISSKWDYEKNQWKERPFLLMRKE